MVAKNIFAFTAIGTPVAVDLIPIGDVDATTEIKSTTLQKISDLFKSLTRTLTNHTASVDQNSLIQDTPATGQYLRDNGTKFVGSAIQAGDLPSHNHNHTDIPDFDTGVQTNRLDQMAAPTASVSLNNQKITLLGTPTGNQDAATKAYVDGLVASNVTLQGDYNASTNTPDLDVSPSGISKGDQYVVSVAGVFFTANVEAGDALIAKQDNPTLESHWIIVQTNLDAASIKTLYESNSNTNAFTDSEKTTLGNQSGTNTGDEPDASTTAKGIVELATNTEVNTGTDATRAITPDALANSSLQSKVNGIEANATADQTDSEIETAYNNQVSIVSQAEAEAGTATTVRRWTAQRVKQAIDALGGGGGTDTFMEFQYSASTAQNSVKYMVIGSASNTGNTTETNVDVTRNFAYTIKRFIVICETYSKDVAVTVGYRDDGATVTSQSVNAVGEFDSGAISVSVASGSLVNIIRDSSSSSSGNIEYTVNVECER